MAILVTGSTGYLGSYIVSELLQNYHQNLLLLIRSQDQQTAKIKLESPATSHGFSTISTTFQY